jgi:hypothetical protein
MNAALLHQSAEVQSDAAPDIKQGIEPSLHLLQNESERVQGETGRYFHLNDGAFTAAKMMVKSIPQWSG